MKYTLLTPDAFNKQLLSSPAQYSYYKTDVGLLKLYLTDDSIYQAFFCDEEPSNLLIRLPTQLLISGTPFQISVWQAALQIPAGKTATYQEIAHAIGRPKAWRAVANALGSNKIAYFIPCHRVLRSNGALGGYKWGIERKQKLLKKESLN